MDLSRQASGVTELDHLLRPTSLKKLEKLLQKHDFWPLDQALDEHGADAIEQLLRGAGYWNGAARLMREDVLLLVRALAEKAQADREKFARAQEMLIADHPVEFKRVRRYVVSDARPVVVGLNTPPPSRVNIIIFVFSHLFFITLPFVLQPSFLLRIVHIFMVHNSSINVAIV